jgi:hypothetical protein
MTETQLIFLREWFREEVKYLIRKEVFPEKNSMNDDSCYWANKAFGNVVSAFCKEDN